MTQGLPGPHDEQRQFGLPSKAEAAAAARAGQVAWPARAKPENSDTEHGLQQRVPQRGCSKRYALPCCCAWCCCLFLLAGGVLYWLLVAAGEDPGPPGGEAEDNASVSVTSLQNVTVCNDTADQLDNIESSRPSCNDTEVVQIQVTEEVQCPLVGSGLDGCPRGALNVTLNGVGEGGGHLRVLLFSTKGGWKSDSRYRGEQAMAAITADAASGTTAFSWEWLLHHDYGVIVHHDRDMDGKLDTNFIGYPSEGSAASEGATGGPFGGPRWEDAKFSHAEAFTLKELDMWYP